MTHASSWAAGYEYATAREWALKLKELAHVHADPYSAADFRHGPIALVDAGFPVLAVAPSGHATADVEALLLRLRDELHAGIVALSDRDDVLAAARWGIRLPTVPEHLMPIASIVPGPAVRDARDARARPRPRSPAHDREGDAHDLSGPTSRRPARFPASPTSPR